MAKNAKCPICGIPLELVGASLITGKGGGKLCVLCATGEHPPVIIKGEGNSSQKPNKK